MGKSFKGFSKALSLILAVAMVVTCVPTSAYAAELLSVDESEDLLISNDSLVEESSNALVTDDASASEDNSSTSIDTQMEADLATAPEENTAGEEEITNDGAASALAIATNTGATSATAAANLTAATYGSNIPDIYFYTSATKDGQTISQYESVNWSLYVNTKDGVTTAQDTSAEFNTTADATTAAAMSDLLGGLTVTITNGKLTVSGAPTKKLDRTVFKLVATDAASDIPASPATIAYVFSYEVQGIAYTNTISAGSNNSSSAVMAESSTDGSITFGSVTVLEGYTIDEVDKAVSWTTNYMGSQVASTVVPAVAKFTTTSATAATDLSVTIDGEDKTSFQIVGYENLDSFDKDNPVKVIVAPVANLRAKNDKDGDGTYEAYLEFESDEIAIGVHDIDLAFTPGTDLEIAVTQNGDITYDSGFEVEAQVGAKMDNVVVTGKNGIGKLDLSTPSAVTGTTGITGTYSGKKESSVNYQFSTATAVNAVAYPNDDPDVPKTGNQTRTYAATVTDNKGNTTTANVNFAISPADAAFSVAGNDDFVVGTDALNWAAPVGNLVSSTNYKNDTKVIKIDNTSGVELPINWSYKATESTGGDDGNFVITGTVGSETGTAYTKGTSTLAAGSSLYLTITPTDVSSNLDASGDHADGILTIYGNGIETVAQSIGFDVTSGTVITNPLGATHTLNGVQGTTFDGYTFVASKAATDDFLRWDIVASTTDDTIYTDAKPGNAAKAVKEGYGLTLNSATGVLSGVIPAEATTGGTFVVRYSYTNRSGGTPTTAFQYVTITLSISDVGADSVHVTSEGATFDDPNWKMPKISVNSKDGSSATFTITNVSSGDIDGLNAQVTAVGTMPAGSSASAADFEINETDTTSAPKQIEDDLIASGESVSFTVTTSAPKTSDYAVLAGYDSDMLAGDYALTVTLTDDNTNTITTIPVTLTIDDALKAVEPTAATSHATSMALGTEISPNNYDTKFKAYYGGTSAGDILPTAYTGGGNGYVNFTWVNNSSTKNIANSGLTLNSDGQIEGTATSVGTFPVLVTATRYFTSGGVMTSESVTNEYSIVVTGGATIAITEGATTITNKVIVLDGNVKNDPLTVGTTGAQEITLTPSVGLTNVKITVEAEVSSTNLAGEYNTTRKTGHAGKTSSGAASYIGVSTTEIASVPTTGAKFKIYPKSDASAGEYQVKVTISSDSSADVSFYAYYVVVDPLALNIEDTDDLEFVVGAGTLNGVKIETNADTHNTAAWTNGGSTTSAKEFTSDFTITPASPAGNGVEISTGAGKPAKIAGSPYGAKLILTQTATPKAASSSLGAGQVAIATNKMIPAQTAFIPVTITVVGSEDVDLTGIAATFDGSSDSAVIGTTTKTAVETAVDHYEDNNTVAADYHLGKLFSAKIGSSNYTFDETTDTLDTISSYKFEDGTYGVYTTNDDVLVVNLANLDSSNSFAAKAVLSGAGASAYDVAIPSGVKSADGLTTTFTIANSGTKAITIKAKADLAVGAYPATLTISGDDLADSIVLPLSFTVASPSYTLKAEGSNWVTTGTDEYSFMDEAKTKTETEALATPIVLNPTDVGTAATALTVTLTNEGNLGGQIKSIEEVKDINGTAYASGEDGKILTIDNFSSALPASVAKTSTLTFDAKVADVDEALDELTFIKVTYKNGSGANDDTFNVYPVHAVVFADNVEGKITPDSTDTAAATATAYAATAQEGYSVANLSKTFTLGLKEAATDCSKYIYKVDAVLTDDSSSAPGFTDIKKCFSIETAEGDEVDDTTTPGTLALAYLTGDRTITLTPKAGLSVGTYKANIVVSAASGSNLKATLTSYTYTFTVTESSAYSVDVASSAVAGIFDIEATTTGIGGVYAERLYNTLVASQYTQPTSSTVTTNNITAVTGGNTLVVGLDVDDVAGNDIKVTFTGVGTNGDYVLTAVSEAQIEFIGDAIAQEANTVTLTSGQVNKGKQAGLVVNTGATAGDALAFSTVTFNVLTGVKLDAETNADGYFPEATVMALAELDNVEMYDDSDVLITKADLTGTTPAKTYKDVAYVWALVPAASNISAENILTALPTLSKDGVHYTGKWYDDTVEADTGKTLKETDGYYVSATDPIVKDTVLYPEREVHEYYNFAGATATTYEAALAKGYLVWDWSKFAVDAEGKVTGVTLTKYCINGESCSDPTRVPVVIEIGKQGPSTGETLKVGKKSTQAYSNKVGKDTYIAAYANDATVSTVVLDSHDVETPATGEYSFDWNNIKIVWTEKEKNVYEAQAYVWDYNAYPDETLEQYIALTTNTTMTSTATCKEPGVSTFTATYNKKDATGKDTSEVVEAAEKKTVPVDSLGHKWTVTACDIEAKTATFTCSECGETYTGAVTIVPSADGTYYTVTAVSDNTITGTWLTHTEHTWKFDGFTWAGDMKSATGTFTCTVGKEQKPATVTMSSRTKGKDAKAITEYTATVAKDPDGKTLSSPISESKYVKADGTPATKADFINAEGQGGSTETEPSQPDDKANWNLFYTGFEMNLNLPSGADPSKADPKAKWTQFYSVDSTGTVTVKATGADNLKKAANATNSLIVIPVFDSDNKEIGDFEYSLPVFYAEPKLKLSSAKATYATKGEKEQTFTTTVLEEKSNKIFEPCELDQVPLWTASGKTNIKEIDLGTDTGAVTITTENAAKGKIKVQNENWAKAIEVSYNIAEGKNDVIEPSATVVNFNANTDKNEAKEISITLNGSDTFAEDAITAELPKKWDSNIELDGIEGGKVTSSTIKISVKDDAKPVAGNYTIKLSTANKGKANIKVAVAKTTLDKAVKLNVKAKMDLTTGQPMVIVPDLKAVNGEITAVEFDEASAALFDAEVNGLGQIVVTAKEADKVNAKTTYETTLTVTVSGVECPTALKFKPAATKPKVKIDKITLPASAFAADVEGTANVLATYKYNKKTFTIAPTKVEFDKATKNESDETISPNGLYKLTYDETTGTIKVEKNSTVAKAETVKVVLTFPGNIQVKATLNIKVDKKK